MTTTTKDNWDKASIIGTLLMGTLIPLAITFYGAKINESIKESETNIKYVEIATSVIRDEPKGEKNRALRRWAVNVLTHYSREVPLTLEAQNELREYQTPIYSTGANGRWPGPQEYSPGTNSQSPPTPQYSTGVPHGGSGSGEVPTSGNYPVPRGRNPEHALESK